ncbi:MAG: FAD-binding oxidoreductase [Candidatus Bathyarchaeia archaeon]
MKLPSTCDVLVIGGGMMGLSIAYRIAEGGCDVTVFEQRNIASGSSGRNGGQIIQLDGRDKDQASIARRLLYAMENNRILDDLPHELCCDFELNRCGSFDVAFTEEEAEELNKLVEIQKKAGDREVEFLEGEEVRKLFPVLREGVCGARYRQTDGNLDPFKLTFGLAAAAKKHKAKIFTHSIVEKILIENGEVLGVSVMGEIVKAKWVINAANAWAPILTPEIDILPLRQVAMLTEPIAPITPSPIETVIDGDVIYTTTQTKSGNVIVGGLRTQARFRQDHYAEDVSPEEIQGSTSIISRLFPSLSHVNIIRTWAGTMGFTADGLPCIGPLPDVRGLVIAAGFSNGMANVAIVGKLVSEFILHDGKTSLPLDPFDPSRFYKKKTKWPEPYNYTVLAEFLKKL